MKSFEEIEIEIETTPDYTGDDAPMSLKTAFILSIMKERVDNCQPNESSIGDVWVDPMQAKKNLKNELVWYYVAHHPNKNPRYITNKRTNKKELFTPETRGMYYVDVIRIMEKTLGIWVEPTPEPEKPPREIAMGTRSLSSLIKQWDNE